MSWLELVVRWIYARFHVVPTRWWMLGMLWLVVPAVWWSVRSSGRVVFSSLRALPAGGETWRTRIAWMPDAMIGLAIVSLVIALTGPHRGDEAARIRREGIAVMMAVDVSGSMKALDLSEKNRELTRLDAVKDVFEKFVLGGKGLDGRPDDAIGLVAFAHYADTRSPLTLDHNNLVTAARQLDFAEREDDGTAIGAGLELAITRLAEFKPKEKVSRIAILLTDGVSNVHDIDEDAAIDDAVKAGIKVYAIGAGTNGIAPIRVTREDGSSDLMQMQVEIDESTLRKIADKTGGQYFRATDHASLEQIYAQIDRLERVEIEQDQFTDYHEYFPVFAIAAMLLVIGAFALRGSVLRRLP
jgi:Ca-activated chloride channel family protein